MNPLDQLKTETAIALAKLQLPTHDELAPYIAKMIRHPGSCVVVVIEFPLFKDGPRVGRCWLSSTEREKMRKALVSVNAKRTAKGEHRTDEALEKKTQQGEAGGDE
jgi:hypothetical protein